MRKHGMSTVEWIEVQVVRVVDGDTVDVAPLDFDGTLLPQFRVRLAGIDAPEIVARRGAPEDDGWRAANLPGIAARLHLMNIVGDRAAKIKPTRAWTDPYGRVIARMRKGDVDVGCAMLDAGHAKVWTDYRRRMLKEVLAQQSLDLERVKAAELRRAAPTP